jgi:hypothetical protein
MKYLVMFYLTSMNSTIVFKQKNVHPISMEICKDIFFNITPKHGICDLTILLSMPIFSHVVVCDM